MNKTPRLSKSGIEYLDYTWGIYSGCQNWKNGVCPLGQTCWAKKITERFKQYYPNGFEPTFYPEAILSPMSLRTPSIIGCAFMGDLFGDWMAGKAIRDTESNLWSGQGIMDSIFQTINHCPQHKFLFLTKCPQNLMRWSPFPGNCWVGVSATDFDTTAMALYVGLVRIDAKVKFISFEPLLERTRIKAQDFIDTGTNWIILGGQSGAKKFYPPREWIDEIEGAADKAGVPVFEKFNLYEYWSKPLRQEMPKEVR